MTADKPTCLTCRHWQPRANPRMAAHGFAPCAGGDAATAYSLHHVCRRHSQAETAIVEARVQWASEREQRRAAKTTKAAQPSPKPPKTAKSAK